MDRFFNLLFHRPSYLVAALWKRVGVVVPDAPYLKVLYLLLVGKRLDIDNPKTFNEKLQWLKLYDRNPEYVKMVDKYAVKDYVAGKIGEEYIIPTLGVWDRAEDIEWDKLPNQFVLKCTHDSGGLVICKDKSQLDKKAAVKKLNKGLKSDYFKIWREWPYKNVPKRIIAEQYIAPSNNVKDLPDYKWYCFNGVPKYCQVIQNRSDDEKIDFFDTNWEHQDFIGMNPEAMHALILPACPDHLDTHLHIASVLSDGFAFARIDLYENGGRTLFGEITLFPMSGMGRFEPEEWNYFMGNLIELPSK